MLARLDIRWCSRALVMLGSPPISSFEDESDEAVVASELYPAVRDELLSAYTWKFATTEATLGRLLGTPPADFQYAYQLPPDLLRVISAGESGSTGLVYRIRGRTLQTDSPSVTLSYIFLPDETEFPPHFVAALVAKLAAAFALPLTESSQRAQTMMAQAENAYRGARVTDSQQQTLQVVQDRTLLNARM